MAQSRSHSNDELKPIVMPSGTGNARHPAKHAPMSAKKTKFLGGEQTSDGRKVERKIERSRENRSEGRD